MRVPAAADDDSDCDMVIPRKLLLPGQLHYPFAGLHHHQTDIGLDNRSYPHHRVCFPRRHDTLLCTRRLLRYLPILVDSIQSLVLLFFPLLLVAPLHHHAGGKRISLADTVARFHLHVHSCCCCCQIPMV